MAYTILVINPGSTSTKIAVYEDEKQLYLKNIEHKADELARFDDILDQEEYRSELIRGTVKEWNVNLAGLSAVMGRGNLLPHMKGGGYLVEENMLEALRAGKASPHASNLGALLAHSIAGSLGIPSYIYDSVTADEFTELAKITGMPGVRRESMCHVLNSKAASRKVAESRGKKYEDMDFIVAHLGGGITISVHHRGKIVDAIRDDAGPFSPERAGSVPLLYVIDMCYSGRHTRKEMIKYIRGNGGLKSYLGTSDCREIEKMIDAGNAEAKMLYEAQAYQIAKGIGEMAPVLNGRFDNIILTGGMVYSAYMTKMVTERVSFIAPVVAVPGENEMEALALGAIRLLNGERYHIYGDETA
ncbi:MAG: butyrate kinase [Treponema sp.]|jgi:butyrate kinase|nr:butyrate kinase [Treponema sp.]